MFSATTARLEHVLVFGYDAPVTSADVETAPHCLVEQDGHKLVVTMNRPEARNALSGEMLAIMDEAWDRVNDDPEIRVCILTGAGGYFCAGMDLKAADQKPPSESFESGEFDPTVIKPLLKGFRLTKPLIAAVEGPAIAGGTEILQGTDIRVAGESAKFGVSEARWSLYPMGGSAVRLPRQIPYTVAADLLLTGRHILAPEAKELGLIGHVVPDGAGAGQGARARRPDRGQRPARRPGHPAGRCATPRASTRTTAGPTTPGSAPPSSPPTDAKEGPRAFAERRPARLRRAADSDRGDRQRPPRLEGERRAGADPGDRDLVEDVRGRCSRRTTVAVQSVPVPARPRRRGAGRRRGPRPGAAGASRVRRA